MKIVPTRQDIDVTMKVYIPADFPQFHDPEIGEDIEKYDALLLERVNAQMPGAIDVLDLDDDAEGDYAIILFRRKFRIGSGWTFRVASDQS